MLYPKSKEPVLSKELFQNPTSEYRGTPFWAWNCELEEDELLWQLEVLKAMGFGGAHMHVRTGMATPYLSDAHMHLIKACVEKCRKEGMLAWLYDEDRWPSGAAGGLVTKDVRYRARYLMMTVVPNVPDGELLACYDVVLDENGCLKKGQRIGVDEEAEGTKWYTYLRISPTDPWFNNQTYINTLDKKAMQRFIDVTYERYLETVGEDFGGVVPAIFTDEPQYIITGTVNVVKNTLRFADQKDNVTMPWTDDLPETFRESYGEEIMDHLPEILWELPDGKVSTVRYHFHDHLTERFAQAFADQCGTWCQEHGLMLTGHMLFEEDLFSQTLGIGEAMRNYRGFQLPGIDMLCNNFEYTTAKQAQSAVHQYGREGMTSELYGVTGWDFDFRGHKLQGDWQAALGVTVRVPHLSWVSMKGEAKRDYPASISYQSPWWKDYPLVENHFARVNTAMTRGKPVVKVGMVHPIETYWLHWGPEEQKAGIRAQLDAQFHEVTEHLLRGCIDFDYLCESLLPDLCKEGGAPLQVGCMAYDTIIVPGCHTLRSTTLDRLEAFQAAGGDLLFLGDAPKFVDAKPSDRGAKLWEKSRHAQMQRESVLDALESSRLVEIRRQDGKRSDNLFYQLRQDGEDRWLFVAHSDMPYNKDVCRNQKVSVQLVGSWSVTLYDTQSGDIRPLPSCVQDGKTCFDVTLYDYDSLLLRYRPRLAEEVRPVAEEMKTGKPIPMPALVAYSLDEPNVYLMDKAEFRVDDGPWQPQQELLRADLAMRDILGMQGLVGFGAVVQPWALPAAKPVHTAHLRFTVVTDRAVPNVTMALEDADVAAVTLNGKTVNVAINGWFTDKSILTFPLGDLKQGENTITVSVPFGDRTNVEWCYLLGDFGVRVMGEHRLITEKPEKLGFDSVTVQGLAHYGSNITYHIPVTTHGGRLKVTVPHYAGAAVRVSMDGEAGYLVCPPYELVLKAPAGEHMLELTLLGNRANCFGPVHLADANYHWLGPDCWRTKNESWTESYRLKPMGILSAPRIEEI